MKASLCLALCLVGAASTPLAAAFTSIKLHPDNPLPEFPLVLISDGVSHGEVVMAIGVSAEGKLTDCLPLAYTHEPFVKACEDVLRQWKFTPAQVDGASVGVKVELTFNFERTGYIESNRMNITKNFISGRQSPRLSQRLIEASQLDSPPRVISTVNPIYPRDAKNEGIRGSVRVSFYIDENGRVRLPSVSSNSHPYLADIAVDALRSWRFQPATYRGRPAVVAAAQDFRFGMEP